MGLAAGKLRHRIRIERLQFAVNSAGDTIQDPNTGEPVPEWVEVVTVWAAIEPLSVREFIQSDAKQSQVVARITIRYRSDLDGAVRLVHVRKEGDGAMYNPAGFLPDKDSNLEYLTSPVSAYVSIDGQ